MEAIPANTVIVKMPIHGLHIYGFDNLLLERQYRITSNRIVKFGFCEQYPLKPIYIDLFTNYDHEEIIGCHSSKLC
ncbi:hypothetical protein TRFO_14047 [Tritrichomonas foetus]|uniref:Uncharacterized protein n=1 Tax=Tritrichomonas foetus TaxID=1144522 RepID=A0A1J4KW36_9EUKA|nr:hypothetical protein TRFO_14047 [Tritrichomonas foetus]|eukprot:OHT15447.1 hypothetical protein TRFO_14047 [Tritrichomonas foetus]